MVKDTAYFRKPPMLKLLEEIRRNHPLTMNSADIFGWKLCEVAEITCRKIGYVVKDVWIRDSDVETKTRLN